MSVSGTGQAQPIAILLDIPEAKAWLLDHKVTVNEVGLGLVNETRAFLDGLEPRELAVYIVGGLATSDLTF